MKSYIEYFEPGGLIEGRPVKRFLNRPFTFTKDTFYIPNISIISDAYNTGKQAYIKIKDELNGNKETDAKNSKESSDSNKPWNNSYLVQSAPGVWLYRNGNPNRNSTTSTNIQ